MHATHQFFLSKRSLYILVLDVRMEDDKTEYWLNHIESFGGDSPVNAHRERKPLFITRRTNTNIFSS